MKQLLILSLLGLSLTLCSSCRNNRLKANEKELVKEIILQEKRMTIDEKTILEKKISETDKKSNVVLRLKENRSVDPLRPPVQIDLTGTPNNTNARIFKLSDVASSIRYVKLQTPLDTSLLYDKYFYRDDLISSVISDGEQIIFQGIFGLTRFNMQGEYLETIWKNEIEIDASGAVNTKKFFGVIPRFPVSMFNGNLYYSFHDGPAGSGQVMRYKSDTDKKISMQSMIEIPGIGPIQGDTLLETNKFILDRFNRTFGTGQNTWVGVNNEWNSGRYGVLLVTYNDNNDTLCQFTDFERIKNLNLPLIRDAVELTSFFYNGLLTIKQEYNDTVFRLIPPERLLPVYKIDFGRYKLSYMDGINPNFDLSEKYILKSLHETDDYLFIRYTQKNDSPNNRKKEAVKFYSALFDKNNGILYHQPGFTFLPEGLINDLDDGIPFWPDFITPQGEMMKLISGKMMKDYINSTGFKESEISEDMRKKQISLASGLKPTDMIVVIAK